MHDSAFHTQSTVQPVHIRPAFPLAVAQRYGREGIEGILWSEARANSDGASLVVEGLLEMGTSDFKDPRIKEVQTVSQYTLLAEFA